MKISATLVPKQFLSIPGTYIQNQLIRKLHREQEEAQRQNPVVDLAPDGRHVNGLLSIVHIGVAIRVEELPCVVNIRWHRSRRRAYLADMAWRFIGVFLVGGHLGKMPGSPWVRVENGREGR